MRLLINIIAFQVGWFACALGAAHHYFLAGPVLVALIFALHLRLSAGQYKAEIAFGLLTLLIGIAVDSTLTLFGILMPVRHYLGFPWTPLWLAAMWLNFACVFSISLRWLRGKYAWAALLGGPGGAMAYYGGASLGALNFPGSPWLTMGILAVVWAVIVPLLLALHAVIEEFCQHGLLQPRNQSHG